MSVMGRLVVADSDPGALELLVARLQIAGYEVVGARDGRAALERVAAARPDGLIVDLDLSELDGFQVLRALRAKAATRDLPVMVLTARGQPAEIKAAVALGARDVLAKPVNSIALMQRVARLVEGRNPCPINEAGAFLI